MSCGFYVYLTLVNMGIFIFSSLENDLSPNFHFSSEKARSYHLCWSKASRSYSSYQDDLVRVTRSENTSASNSASLWDSWLNVIYLHWTTQSFWQAGKWAVMQKGRLSGAFRNCSWQTQGFSPWKKKATCYFSEVALCAVLLTFRINQSLYLTNPNNIKI